jgi:hypothetical protein
MAWRQQAPTELGNDQGDFMLRAFSAPGAAIAKNRDFYGELKAEQDRAAAAAAANQTEREAIAERRRQFEVEQSQPQFLEVGAEGGTQFHKFSRSGEDLGPVGGIKPTTAGGWNTPAAAEDYFKAADDIANLDKNIGDLHAALDLNDKTFTGAPAGPMSTAIQAVPEGAKDIAKRFFPGAAGKIDAASAAASATEQIDKLTQSAALQLNQALLKGSISTWEGQKALGQLQSSDPKIRREGIQAALDLFERQKQIAVARQRVYGGGGTAGRAAPAAAPPPPAAGGGARPATGGLSPEDDADIKNAVQAIGALPPEAQPAKARGLRDMIIKAGGDPAQYGL